MDRILFDSFDFEKGSKPITEFSLININKYNKASNHLFYLFIHLQAFVNDCNLLSESLSNSCKMKRGRRQKGYQKHRRDIFPTKRYRLAAKRCSSIARAVRQNLPEIEIKRNNKQIKSRLTKYWSKRKETPKLW